MAALAPTVTKSLIELARANNLKAAFAAKYWKKSSLQCVGLNGSKIISDKTVVQTMETWLIMTDGIKLWTYIENSNTTYCEFEKY